MSIYCWTFIGGEVFYPFITGGEVFSPLDLNETRPLNKVAMVFWGGIFHCTYNLELCLRFLFFNGVTW